MLSTCLTFILLVPGIFMTDFTSEYECSNSAGTVVVDYLFLIDLSPSMNPLLKGIHQSASQYRSHMHLGVKLGVHKFLDNLQKLDSNVRFGIVSFGGVPQIRMPFTVS